MKLFYFFIVLFVSGLIVSPGCKKHNEIVQATEIDSLFYTPAEALVIFNNDSAVPMSTLLSSVPEDSLFLSTSSRNVKIVNDTTAWLINRMIRTVQNRQINGISAPVVGIHRNIIVVKRKDKTGNPLEVFINPKITQHSNATTVYQESCVTNPQAFPLSMNRYNLIVVDYYTPDGIYHNEMIESETAAFVQHEIDHLHPTVYIDPLAFTGQEIDSIMADTVAMRIYLTSNFQDSLVLRKTSIDVRPDNSNPVLIRVINRMRKSLAASSGGVGIAAPQIGINRNIILVKRLDKIGTPVEVYLNPKIVMTSDSIINFAGDGCLSIPGLYLTTKRYTAVGIEYDLLNGTHKSEVIFGYSGTKFTAVIFQHEIDHLFGILFIDRV